MFILGYVLLRSFRRSFQSNLFFCDSNREPNRETIPSIFTGCLLYFYVTPRNTLFSHFCANDAQITSTDIDQGKQFVGCSRTKSSKAKIQIAKSRFKTDRFSDRLNMLRGMRRAIALVEMVWNCRSTKYS